MRQRAYVAIYELDRSYGGPEEGGWWFTTGEIRKTIRCRPRSLPNARRQAAAWVARRGAPRRPLGSVIYSGGEYRVCAVVGRRPAASFPSRRPRYE